MKKPVWRINTGNGVPSDLFNKRGSLLFYNGSIYNGYNICAPIAAYQTTHTKAAKYKRVDCSCNRTGLILERKICPYCNGKGYTLEKIK